MLIFWIGVGAGAENAAPPRRPYAPTPFGYCSVTSSGTPSDGGALHDAGDGRRRRARTRTAPSDIPPARRSRRGTVPSRDRRPRVPIERRRHDQCRVRLASSASRPKQRAEGRAGFVQRAVDRVAHQLLDGGEVVRTRRLGLVVHAVQRPRHGAETVPNLGKQSQRLLGRHLRRVPCLVCHVFLRSGLHLHASRWTPAIALMASASSRCRRYRG